MKDCPSTSKSQLFLHFYWTASNVHSQHEIWSWVSLCLTTCTSVEKHFLGFSLPYSSLLTSTISRMITLERVLCLVTCQNQSRFHNWQKCFFLTCILIYLIPDINNCFFASDTICFKFLLKILYSNFRIWHSVSTVSWRQ